MPRPRNFARRGNGAVHWNNLSADAREMLRKFVEGSDYEPTDQSLVKLIEDGLIEQICDGWRATPAGYSVYVVRDQSSRSAKPSADPNTAADPGNDGAAKARFGRIRK